MELTQAIAKMERGGSADGILQVGFEQAAMMLLFEILDEFSFY